MKCILKAREGYGAKILYYKEDELGRKKVYKDEKCENQIYNYDINSIIIIKEDSPLIKIGDELFLPLGQFSEIKEKFFS